MGRSGFVREPADVRRRSLIDAAARCLAERGAAGASVRAICAEAGISPGLLTYYFSGVDALIAAAYRDVGAKVAAAIGEAVAEAGEDPRARLHAYAAASFAPPVLDPELLATWLAFWSLVKTDPAIAAIHEDIYGDYRSGLEALIGEALGGAPDAERVRLAAVAISALVDGLWLELCLGNASFTAAEAAALAARWIDTLLAP